MPTSPYVPRPQIGRHMQSCTIAPMTVANDGSLTKGAAIPIYVNRRNLSFDITPERSEINGASSTRHNEVVLADGMSMNLEIFLVNNGTDPNALFTAAASADYFQVDWVVGTVASSIETFSFIGVRGPLSVNNSGRGEHVATLELGPADVGRAQIQRAVN